jgi:hypothetical protein
MNCHGFDIDVFEDFAVHINFASVAKTLNPDTFWIIINEIFDNFDEDLGYWDYLLQQGFKKVSNRQFSTFISMYELRPLLKRRFSFCKDFGVIFSDVDENLCKIHDLEL